MSGGFIELQQAGDHQVVTFTFIGEITAEKRAQWNQAILDLKEKFAPNLVGVTVRANPTPNDVKK